MRVPEFINLTKRRSKTMVLVNIDMITSIIDLRTDPACTEDFHYTVVKCGSDVHEVKETMQEIADMLATINSRHASL